LANDKESVEKQMKALFEVDGPALLEITTDPDKI